MQIRIGADVTQALRGLQQVDDRLRTTSAAGQSFGRGIDRATAAIQKIPQSSGRASAALTDLSRVAQDAPYGFIGIANNLNPLFDSFARLRTETGSVGGAFKSLGSQLLSPGGIGFAVAILSSAFLAFGDKLGLTKVKFSEAEIAAGKFEVALNRLQASTERLKKSLEFEGKFQRLMNEMSGATGSALSALNTSSDINVRTKELADIDNLTKKLTESNLRLIDSYKGAFNAAGRFGITSPLAKLIAEFKDPALIPENLREKLKGADKAILTQFQKTNDELKKLNERRLEILFDTNLSVAEVGVSLTKELNQKPVVAKPEKIIIQPSKVELGPFGVNAFDFEAALMSRIKIPKIKAAFDITGGSVAGTQVGDGKEDQKRIANYTALGNLITGFVTPAFDAMFDTIAKGGNVFKAFGQMVIQAMTQVIAKLATTAALAAIISAVTGTAGFNGAVGFRQIFNQFLGFRATGGPMSANRPYMVGERGPELVIPSSNSRVIPNNQLAGIAGSAKQMIEVFVTGRISGNDLVLAQARQNRYNDRNV